MILANEVLEFRLGSLWMGVTSTDFNILERHNSGNYLLSADKLCNFQPMKKFSAANDSLGVTIFSLL